MCGGSFPTKACGLKLIANGFFPILRLLRMCPAYIMDCEVLAENYFQT